MNWHLLSPNKPLSPLFQVHDSIKKFVEGKTLTSRSELWAEERRLPFVTICPNRYWVDGYYIDRGKSTLLHIAEN